MRQKFRNRILALCLSVATTLSVISAGISVPAALSGGDGKGPSVSLGEADLSTYAANNVAIQASNGYGTGNDQTANKPMAGAEFTVKFYANKNDFKSADEFKGYTPTRTWVIRTDDDGKTDLKPPHLVEGKSDALYYVDDVAVVPLGAITIEETKPPEGYRLDPSWKDANGNYISGTVIWANCVPDADNQGGASIQYGNFQKDGTVYNSAYVLTIDDPVYQGGLRLEKFDLDQPDIPGQGSARIGALTFRVYNESDYPVSVGGKTYAQGALIYEGKTDDEGRWQSAADWLPFGNYRVEEVIPPNDYTKEGVTSIGFAVTEANADTLVSVSFSNEVVRCSLGLFKGDENRHAEDDHPENTPQGNAVLSGAVYRIRYADVANNIYPIRVDGKTYQKGQVLDYRLITNEQGFATTPPDYLPVGTYTVFEETASNGYLVNKKILGDWTLTRDAQYIERSWADDYDEPVIRGGVDFIKIDADLNRAQAQGDAALSGAVYTITNKSKNSVWVYDASYTNENGRHYRKVEPNEVAFTLTTDANGHFSLPENALPFGHYEFKEVTPSAGYHLNETVYQFDIINDKEIVKLGDGGTSTEDVVRGGFEVQKRDKDTYTTTPQGDAALGSFDFTVTNISSQPVYVNGREYAAGAVVFRGSSNSSGYYKSASNLLPYGTYRFDEVTPPTGYYAGMNTSFTFSVREEGTIYDGTETISNPVQRFGLIIMKRDIETGLNRPLGGASLAGGKYELVNKSIESVYIDGVRYKPGDVIYTFESDENGYIRNDEVSVQENGKWITVKADTLPYGTYLVRETEPPKGYLAKGVLERTFSVIENGSAYSVGGKLFPLDGNGSIVDLSRTDESILNQIVRGDFSIRKIDAETQKKMSGVKFRVTSMTTGESHEFTTNENGGYRSSARFNLHTQDTNGGKADSGMWFGQYVDEEGNIKYTDVNNMLGALPFDTYYIEELRCEANEGYRLWSDVFTITRENDERGDDYEVNLNNIENFKYKLTSKAFNTEDKSKLVPAAADVAVTDTVYYENLEAGKSYTLTSFLYNATTGEPLRDANGNTVMRTNEFTPKDGKGEYSVIFYFDAQGIEGGRVVVYQFLHETESGELVAKESDPDNEDQTVTIPSVSTSAVEASTGYNVVGSNDVITIKDTVFYAGVEEGLRYTIKGVLYDRESGQPLLDADGHQITAGTTFRAHGADGYETVTFTLSGKGLEGKQIVVFETLYRVNIDDEYCYHRNLKDRDQTVYIPEISSTEAKDSHNIKNVVASENSVVVDTVNFGSVREGLTYRVDGVLYDLTADAEIATGTTTVVPDGETGSAEVRFEFDATGLAGHILVVYEKMYVQSVSGTWELVAVHEDAGDKGQTVYVPKIGTTLTDSETKSHTSYADGSVTLNDVVKYESLAPNTSYVLKAILMNRETGTAMLGRDGNVITAQAQFETGDETTGEAVVTFKFDGSHMAGIGVVAYEELYQVEILLTSHKDIEDAEQLVRFPVIGTTVHDSKTGEHLTLAEKDGVIIDTVEYENLVPGIEYTLDGVIVDQMNSAELSVGHTAFVPESENGTVDVEFKIDARQLKNHTVVAFETLKCNGAPVAEHKDIHDEAQSTHVPQIMTSAVVGKQYDYIEPAPVNPDPSIENWVKVTSVVKYHNLTPGLEYVINSTLTDNKTGEPILDAAGSLITATATITPKEPDGEIEMEYSFQAPVDYEVKGEEAFAGGYIYYEITENTKNIYGDKGAVIVDTVTYSNLIRGLEYTLTGTLMDKDTGKPITDADGNPVMASKVFTAPLANGEIDLEFLLDAGSNHGKTIVVFEELSINGANVAEHKDLNDPAQTLYVPELDTVAVDGKTGLHMAQQCSGMWITDTVSYTAVQPGKTYTVRGTLMDKDTRTPLTDNSGREIVAEQTFVATSSRGSVTLSFEFENFNLAGRTIVVFEELIENNFVIGEHKDFDDEDQTVHVPKIMTELLDSATGAHIALATDGAVLVDTVTYTNLIPGIPYQIRGELVDAKTGEPVATAKTVFRPETSSGSIPVEFTVDAAELAGRSVVAYEEFYANCSALIARHADIKDAGQTVQFPAVGTTANGETDKNIMSANDSVVTDTVAYENLIPGLKYTVTGVLMNKDTGAAVEGQTVSVEFAPADKNGTVDVEFRLAAGEHAGETLVAFEEITLNGKAVAEHKDLNDEKQTVYVPELDTVAVDGRTGLHMAHAASGMTIVDTVTYRGLQPGKTYTMRGTLMDKDAKAPLTDKDGKNVVVEKEFTATASTGSVAIEFNFENNDMADKTLVVFEELLDSGFVIGEHKDFDDDDQTVYVPKVGTELVDDRTGKHITFAEEDAAVTDIIRYSNLIPNVVYEIRGELVDAASGRNVASAVKTFRPLSASGEIEVNYNFDAKAVAGHSVVAFEELYAYSSALVASHRDIADEAQTVRVPSIATYASNADADTKNIPVGGNAQIQDVITYTNLLAGETYTVTGRLIDKETGEQLGEDVSVEFEAPSVNGKATLTFGADTAEWAGKTVVLFETIELGGRKVAAHEDVNDADQTVYLPKVSTSASDSETGLKIAEAKQGLSIRDEVAYEHLQLGKSYTLKGYAVDKTTGEQISDAATVEFEAKASEGSATMIIIVDASQRAGRDIVVFEEIYEGSIKAAAHADITDESQTIHIPVVSTAASDVKTGGHMAFAESEMRFVDTVTVDNILPGYEYELVTVLVNKTTSEVIEFGGSEAGVSRFTADGKGIAFDVEVVLEDYADKIIGNDVVFYEYLRIVTPDGVVPVAEHASTNDENQTVRVPHITTSAMDTTTETRQLNGRGYTVVEDTVAYDHLIPGETYTVSGKLVNKADGSDFIGPDGEAVTGSVTFVAESEEGSVVVSFEIDTTGIAGESLVCFETLSWNDHTVAEHTDIDAENQTVRAPRIQTYLHIDEEKSSGVGGTIAIVDDIYYYNLLPGYTYRVNGILMDKETGEARLDRYGNPYTGETVFVADESGNGLAHVEFAVNTNDMADGVTLVAFERLSIVLNANISGEIPEDVEGTGNAVTLEDEIEIPVEVPVEKPIPDIGGTDDDDFFVDNNGAGGSGSNGNGIFDDEDLDNEDETVRIPAITINTVAADANGNKTIYPVSNEKLVDTIAYTNLRSGETYKFVGMLMNWLTGEALLDADGNPVMSEVEFVPETPNGVVDMEFEFDATQLNGARIVVFQQLYHGDDMLKAHEDWLNADQTVDVALSYMTTEAMAGGEKSTPAAADTVITDTIRYEGLKPGETYTVRGELFDAETGESLGVTAEASFTAESSSGTAAVIFTVDTSDMNGRTIVVFETLYHGENYVAEHRDITDEAQSVAITAPIEEVPEPEPPLAEPEKPAEPPMDDVPDDNPPISGPVTAIVNNSGYFAIGFGLIAVVLACAYVFLNRKPKETSEQ